MQRQPPSGGCVLKQSFISTKAPRYIPAAFGRLCVETIDRLSDFFTTSQPPSGGCVLKLPVLIKQCEKIEPAAFGRLCVETKTSTRPKAAPPPSRLRAAVC